MWGAASFEARGLFPNSIHYIYAGYNNITEKVGDQNDFPIMYSLS